jgi:hypothetical protein
MFCASFIDGGPRVCTTPISFEGALCRDDADCTAPALCTYYSPFHTQLDLGTCLLPCDAAHNCPPAGGLRHTCLDFLDRPVCYPGEFGLYCRSDADCLPGLTCQQVSDVDASDAVVVAPRCTLPCAVDQDCKGNALSQYGWCSEGLCAFNRTGGRLCDRSAQCSSGTCEPSMLAAELGSGIERCRLQPGGAP